MQVKMLSQYPLTCGRGYCLKPVLTYLRGLRLPSGQGIDHGRHVMSSSPVPLKTRRIGQRCTLNLSRGGVLAQVSSTSFDHGSKLRGPSPKALVQLNSATLIFTHVPPQKTFQCFAAVREVCGCPVIFDTLYTFSETPLRSSR
ncbi:hypothetical protein TNCV_4265941 [Trichonephila clavipes]|nr:hypothetical protein TNCV_4265941 [Trichonephila clavipes]